MEVTRAHGGTDQGKRTEAGDMYGGGAPRATPGKWETTGAYMSTSWHSHWAAARLDGHPVSCAQAKRSTRRPQCMVCPGGG